MTNDNDINDNDNDNYLEFYKFGGETFLHTIESKK